MKSISIGAEAAVYQKENLVVKVRLPKNYRIKEIDTSIRRSRTKLETMLLNRIEHLNISPKVASPCSSSTQDLFEISPDLEMKYAIFMEYIPGQTLKECLHKQIENTAYIRSILVDVYKTIGLLHKEQVVHGDLTPNNIIISNGTVKIIDFGLGKISNKAEDKAVDLYVFERTTAALVNVSIEPSFSDIFKAYEETNIKNGKDVLNKLKEVRRRGRKRELNAVG